MGVDDLTGQGFALPNVAREAAILSVGSRVGEMLRETPVAADAEVGLLDRAETEAVPIVVARGAQAPAQLSGRSISDKVSRVPSRGRESVSTQRRPRRPVAVQRALTSALEVLAGKCLLELGLVTPPTLGVAHRFREVGMATGRVALPATDAAGRVTTLTVGGRRGRMARHTVLDVGRRSRIDAGARPIRSPWQKKAAGGGNRREGPEHCSAEPRHPRTTVHLLTPTGDSALPTAPPARLDTQACP